MNGPLFEVSGVSKVYRLGEVEVTALKDVSLEVQAGEYVAVMGPSGSGKSTFLHLLGLLDRPTTGRVLIAGQDTGRLGERELARLRNRRLGFVFQAFNLLPRTSVLENVTLPLEYAGLPAWERASRGRALLARVGLGDRERHQPNQLSGGQQQRVAIARALASDPAAILADEPTGNLDSHSAAEILSVFDELHREGRTIVLITHDPKVAARVQRQIVFHDGSVLSDELRAA